MSSIAAEPFSRCVLEEFLWVATNQWSLPEVRWRRTVKTLNSRVKRCDNRVVSRCSHDTVPNITVIRRHNALALFQEYAAAKIAAGEPAKGMEQAFAAELEISPSMWSQIKSSRPISDKLARQIESHMKRPPGWLDTEHGVPTSSAAEERFIELARAAWRAANAEKKRELLRVVRGEHKA